MLKTVSQNHIKKSPWRHLGRIRLGTKNEKGFPVDLDHFLIPESFRAKLGDKPRELQIMLAHPTLEQNFDTMAAIWQSNGSKLCWTRDDVTAQRYELVDPSQGERGPRHWVTMPCPNTACQFRMNGKNKARGTMQCNPSGIFQFMVPACGDPGTFDINIKSQVGIQNIYSVLEQVQEMVSGRPQGMYGIRMILRRVPVEFHKDIKGDGNQATLKKWIVTLEIDVESLMLEDSQRLMLQAPKGPQLIEDAEVVEEVES